MGLQKRYCVEYEDGAVRCYRDDSFWYGEKGTIIKWVIFCTLFFIFMAWFVGGYIHAKRRLAKGLPLLAYHRFLISYPERKRHGQVPQNHFTFYQQPNLYAQRADGTFAGPPPMYGNSDAPPQYYAPQGPPKPQGMEMPPYQQGAQQSGVVRSGDEQGQSQELPPRPQQAKAALRGFVDRFRK